MKDFFKNPIVITVAVCLVTIAIVFRVKKARALVTGDQVA